MSEDDFRDTSRYLSLTARAQNVHMHAHTFKSCTYGKVCYTIRFVMNINIKLNATNMMFE